jgi:hypothetical protein
VLTIPPMILVIWIVMLLPAIIVRRPQDVSGVRRMTNEARLVPPRLRQFVHA